MKNVLVIFNPNAGRKLSVKYKKSVINFLLHRGCSFKTISIENLFLSHYSDSDFDTVIVIGGDGTVSKSINYFINSNINLAIIPAGTANLFAQKLGIPSNLSKALKIIDSHNTQLVDLLKINNIYSVLRVGFGYDSDIICKTPQSLKNKFGYFAYFISGIIFAFRLKQKKYNLFIDNVPFQTNASCFIIANAANMYKNIFSIADSSFLDDGIFEILILKTVNPFLFFLQFLKIIFNIRVNSPSALYLKASNIIIENEFSSCHIDGEKIKLKNNISIQICKSRINFFSNIKTSTFF